MSALRQLLGGLAAGAVILSLIAGGVILSAGDATVALLPTPTPSNTQTVRPTPTPSPTRLTPSHTPTLVPTGACPRPAGWIDYTVMPGDDLASIANAFNIAAVLLQVNNCLNDPAVTPGQILFVPQLTPTPTPSPIVSTVAPTLCGPPLGWVLYTVRPGDTLSSLARATNTTVQQIKLANCLTSDQIQVGQRLFLPRLPAPSPSRTPTPTPTLTPTATSSLASATPTFTPVVNTPTDTPTPTPTETPTPIIIQTPTDTPTVDLPPTTQPSPTNTPPPTDAPTLPATP